MDDRAAKLALARKKLKEHQEKKCLESVKKSSISSLNSDLSACNNNEVCENYPTITAVGNVPESQHHTGFSTINTTTCDAEVYPTELLTFHKQNLELENTGMRLKLAKLENDYEAIIQQYNDVCKRNNFLESELKNINSSHEKLSDLLVKKDILLKELDETRKILMEEKTNLQEQLEFTKSVLMAKETENDSLNSQLYNMQNQLEATQLQLQQLTSGISSFNSEDPKTFDTLKCENEILQQKVSTLEQQLKQQIRDYQQSNSHYENYVSDLASQLQNATKKNEELRGELQLLSDRESSLVEQISEMEIRLQNYSSMLSTNVENTNTTKIMELEDHCHKLQEKISELNIQLNDIQKKYTESLVKIEELCQSNKSEKEENDVISLTKLSADITSDKIAVQRATEQNKKLKQDIQGLEDAFVKMSKDKLELVEKLSAEKFLNQELTIKLAEVDEKFREMQVKLKAKDDEMIRLQTNLRELEQKYDELEIIKQNHDEAAKEINEHACNNGEVVVTENEVKQEHDCPHVHHNKIPKNDAMLKLQERFLKIMGDVADLSDEKHRLEHIITQLQNETETICEYVALYQQQRSLLKKRDEERNSQIKIYQTECKKLQSQLDELTGILTKFAEDQQLTSYFEIQAKHEDIKKVMSLLKNLKTNTLIDPDNKMEFRSYYPCNCCSGKLIEV